MTNLAFFKTCFEAEIKGTVAIFNSLPPHNMDFRPHPINKSAKEQVEHLLCHLDIFDLILKRNVCSEGNEYLFNNNFDAAIIYEEKANRLLNGLVNMSEEKWENEDVELLADGKTVMTLPRFRMMWVFLFDTIHHRGQLSSYIRAMGGKNPSVYGSSADAK
jgi:uncharacterized damage-inducible protein DinB